MKNPNGFQDKRQHARFELLEYSLVQQAPSEESIRSVVIDVSLGGLQVRSRHQFEQGGVYHLSLGRTEAHPLRITAEVRYSVKIDDTDLYATGFRCQAASADERMEWVDYVHEIFKTQGESLVC